MLGRKPYTPVTQSKALDQLLDDLQESPSPSTIKMINCCCEEKHCKSMHNHESVILGLERDVKKAAELGMALLSRHETFVAEAQAEQAKMTDMLEAMENENRTLEQSNQLLIGRNRDLLNELEHLNEALTSSEENSIALSNDLAAMNCEVTRLNILTSRCEQLEDQLSILDIERGGLRKALASSQKNEVSLAKKWNAAETAQHEISDRLWTMEGENKEAKIRNDHLHARLHRTQEDHTESDEEKEKLQSQLQQVVEANAVLESSETELREMLSSAHDEINWLHVEMAGRHTSLDLETDVKEPRKSLSQELHVHHHYHRAQRKRSTMLAKRKTPRTPSFQEHLMKAGLPTPPSSVQLSATSLDFEHSGDQRLSISSKLRRSLSNVDSTPSRQFTNKPPTPSSSPPDSPRPRRAKSFILPAPSPFLTRNLDEDISEESVTHTPIAIHPTAPRKSASHESILAPSQVLKFGPKIRAQACFVSSPTMATSSTEFSFTEANAMHHTREVSASLSQQLLTVANGRTRPSRVEQPKRGWTFWKPWSAVDLPKAATGTESIASERIPDKYKEPDESLQGIVNQSLLAESLG